MFIAEIESRKILDFVYAQLKKRDYDLS